MSVSIASLPLEDRKPVRFRLFVIGEGDSFPVLDYLDDLQSKNETSFNRLMAMLGHMASDGPITNDHRKSRLLCSSPKIYEFKTPDQNRMTYFYDSDHVVICVHAFAKPKPKGLRKEIKIASQWYERYFEAKAKNQLKLLPNE